MSDALQFAIVTALACVSLAAIVRPYFRRTPAGTAPGCASCPGTRVSSDPRKKPGFFDSRSATTAEAQPLRLIRR